jgi:hypothetical protein
MSVERERILAAEMLAVKSVMAHVLGRINQLDPVLAEAIQGGFEDAEGKIRKTMAKSRQRVTSDQGVKALAVIEAPSRNNVSQGGKPQPVIGRQRQWRQVGNRRGASRSVLHRLPGDGANVAEIRVGKSTSGRCCFQLACVVSAPVAGGRLCYAHTYKWVRRNLTGDGIIFFAKQCPGDI